MVNMRKWHKKGLLFGPNISGYSHASHPAIVNVQDELFIVAFSARFATFPLALKISLSIFKAALLMATYVSFIKPVLLIIVASI